MKIAVSARNGSWDFECAAGEKILHAALRSGVELPYECATGTCGTCKATLVSGRHESHWPDAPGHRYLKSAAEILTCQSVAHEDCQLEVGLRHPHRRRMDSRAIEHRLPLDELGCPGLAVPGAALGLVGLELQQVTTERIF